LEAFPGVFVKTGNFRMKSDDLRVGLEMGFDRCEMGVMLRFYAKPAIWSFANALIGHFY
jgi:hypothetical protein